MPRGQQLSSSRAMVLSHAMQAWQRGQPQGSASRKQAGVTCELAWAVAWSEIQTKGISHPCRLSGERRRASSFQSALSQIGDFSWHATEDISGTR